uniref:Ovule protein n=1 Tax=Caenorhabditis tropicalis TaxID=1561998 RepID=A0A1I7T9J0_9PELO
MQQFLLEVDVKQEKTRELSGAQTQHHHETVHNKEKSKLKDERESVYRKVSRIGLNSIIPSHPSDTNSSMWFIIVG